MNWTGSDYFFAAILIGALLRDYSALRLVQVVQGTAVVTLLLNLIALWKHEMKAWK